MRFHLLFGLIPLVVACSGTDDGSSGTGSSGASSGSGSSSSSGQGSSSSGSSGGSSSGSLGGHFRHGVNYGYTPGISDEQASILARAAGANSARISLPERHLEMWGYEIETGDNATYVKNGITQ